MGEKYVLQMIDIKKEYYGNKVLKGINLNLKPGEIMTLVGENGAGKSTLMNILFGMEQIRNTGGFSGKILFDGKEASISAPEDAIRLGIGMVHQEFMLLPGFTITENIKLNREILKPGILSRIFGKRLSRLDRETMGQDARRSLDKIGLNIREDEPVSGLPVGYMQFVEIARELDKSNMKLIVFDEPTAVLTEVESQRLLDTMKKIASEGVAVIFISHKLDEVMEVSDTIMILRDGEHIKTVNKEDTDVIALAELMVGRGIDAGSIAPKRNFDDSDIILSIGHLSVDMPGEAVKDFSLNVRRGEIIGLGGLAGQGKIGVSNGILGIYPAEGTVSFHGSPLPLNSPLQVLKKSVAFVSEDRKNVGLILNESIEQNIAVGALRVKGRFLKKYGPFTQVDTKARRENAHRMIKDFQIKCVSERQHVADLSGGNQQKVCLAKALTMEPELLFVSEPTRGIDIGAKQVVLDHLVQLNREKGVTIIMTSSELKELRSVCDRIAIVTDGKLETILTPYAGDVEFGLAMSGARKLAETQDEEMKK
ncbi:MAG: sugar ABC transporter ATP-binding protein [Eubacteriales bacterium]|nr:sugar ABC transporter ATP-binding protein [Eubacteriales bacterium]